MFRIVKKGSGGNSRSGPAIRKGVCRVGSDLKSIALSSEDLVAAGINGYVVVLVDDENMLVGMRKPRPDEQTYKLTPYSRRRAGGASKFNAYKTFRELGVKSLTGNFYRVRHDPDTKTCVIDLNDPVG